MAFVHLHINRGKRENSMSCRTANLQLQISQLFAEMWHTWVALFNTTYSLTHDIWTSNICTRTYLERHFFLYTRRTTDGVLLPKQPFYTALICFTTVHHHTCIPMSSRLATHRNRCHCYGGRSVLLTKATIRISISLLFYILELITYHYWESYVKTISEIRAR